MSKHRKVAAAPFEPHQHDFEELIIGIECNIEHFIDYRNTQAPFVSFITQGKTTCNSQIDRWPL